MQDLSERNELILADKKNGMTVCEIAKKYGVTRARVYQICQKAIKSDERKKTELWKRLESAAKKLGDYDEPQVSRAYNIVMRARKEVPNTWPIRYITFEEIPRSEWSGIRNCGEKTLRLLHFAFPE